jgi:hypothetical protein
MKTLRYVTKFVKFFVQCIVGCVNNSENTLYSKNADISRIAREIIQIQDTVHVVY